MHIDHLTGSITTGGGGISSALAGLLRAQLAAGSGARVVGWNDGQAPLAAWPSDAVVELPLRRRWGCLPMAEGMEQVLRATPAGVLHVHGLWTGASLQGPAHRKPYVVSPHGMLDAWALRQSKWKKRLAGRWFERRNLEQASVIHALCAAEANAIRVYGLRNPIAIIPNGIELPEEASESRNVESQNSERPKTLLFLGRIHPKKGLVNALRAWGEVKAQRSKAKGQEEWQFVVAGWDQGGHQDELARLCDELGICHETVNAKEWIARSDEHDSKASVVFVGPAFDLEKEQLLRRADAFILPSFSEGLPMSVLEAWSYGLPVMMTEHCNLPEGFHAGAAIRIDADVNRISDGLDSLFSASSSDLTSMGLRGRVLVEEKFTWPQVAAQMKEVYEWTLGGGTAPSCVEFL